MMRAMKSREELLSNSLFKVARLTFEGPDGGEIVRDVIEHRGACLLYTSDAADERVRV